MRTLHSAVFLLGGILMCSQARGDWRPDPSSGGMPVCTRYGSQLNPVLIKDGSGGVFVAWIDQGVGSDVYVQHVDRDGVPLWTADGVAATTGAEVGQLDMASDGAGGIVLVWLDGRSGFSTVVYGQRVNASGTPLWSATGVLLSTIGTSFNHPIRQELQAVKDGAGGAIMCWQEHSEDRFGNAGPDFVRAQRVDGTGVRQWGTNGITFSSGAGGQEYPSLADDGSGGAIVTWDEYRPAGSLPVVYAQRVNMTGAIQWTWSSNGVGVQANAWNPSIVGDGTGGAIIACTSVAWDIYAMRLGSDGYPAWFTSTVVCNATGSQSNQVLCGDGAGGSVIAWMDPRPFGMSVYAQRLDGYGNPHWAANGIQVASSPGLWNWVSIVSDDAGGALIGWSDGDIRARHVDVNGAIASFASRDVCTAVDGQYNQAIASDGRGGAILAWHDLRPGNHLDIYAQRVDFFGFLGDPSPRITSIEDIPNDQGGQVKLSWSHGYVDNEFAPGTFDYQAWRESAPDTWTLLGTQPNGPLDNYSMVVTTSADSGVSNAYHTFRVEARWGASPGNPFWYSPADSGYSVDNVTPSAPLVFTGAYANGTTQLTWTAVAEPDLAGYRVYRGATVDFEAGPSNLIGEPKTAGYTDAPGAPFAYRVSAVDRNGNESASISWSPSGLGAVNDGTVLRLDAPRPNPALLRATLQFSLPAEVSVSLEVCDIAGRRVRELSAGRLDAGEHRLEWDLRNSAGVRVAPGMYFVRLRTDVSSVLTRPLLVVR